MRYTGVWLWSASVTVGAVVGLGSTRQADEVRPPPVTDVRAAVPARTIPRALAVFRAWDRRRAQAWAAADPEALAVLYAPGAPSGRRDLRHLERWSRRGLRVTGLRHQVASVTPRRGGPGRLTVVATTRLVSPVARDGRRAVALPAGGWRSRRITWRSRHGRWVVVDMRPVGRSAG